MGLRLRDRLFTNNTIHKNFEYSKGKVSLQFSLRIDIKDNLRDFLDLLKRAQDDVEAELAQQ